MTTRKTIWYIYHLSPIDFGWENLPEFEDVLCNVSKLQQQGSGNGTYIDTAQFVVDYNRAKELAARNGWEGDYRETPRVFFLPADNEFTYGFVWKHDNNGDTFVVSPVGMPWLDDTTVSLEIAE